MAEFVIAAQDETEPGDGWLLIWAGGDGRRIATCPNRFEAKTLCALANKHGLADTIIKRAGVGLALHTEREGGK